MRRGFRRIREHISTKFIVSFALCLILPLSVLGSLYTTRMRDILMDAERDSLARMADRGIADLEQLVLEMNSAITALAISASARECLNSSERPPSYEWFRVYRTFENLLETVAAKSNSSLKITAVSRDDKVYHIGAQYNLFLTMHSPVVRRVLEGGTATTVLNRRLEGLDGSDMFTVGKTYFDKGQPLGVILVDVAESSVGELFRSFGGAQVYVQAQDGRLLYTNDLLEGEPPDAAGDLNLPQAGRALIGGEPHLVIRRSSPRTGLTVTALISERLVFAATSATTGRYIAIFCAILCLTAGVTVFMSRRLSRRIQRLNSAVSHFAQTGQAISEPPLGVDEVGQLGAGIIVMSSQIQALLNRTRADAHEKWQLEFRALQSQINPHMIYNTLNTITYLAQLQNVANIEEVSSSFARLLRMVSNREDEFISVREELACVEAFVAIKRYNLSWDIRCEIDARQEALDCRMLRLLLQPFVENAIVHGFSERDGAGVVLLSVALKNGMVVIDIRDNGAGIGQDTLRRVLHGEVNQPDSFSNVGIHNTVRRLTLKYGKEAVFSIDSRPGEGTLVHIEYPAEPMGGKLGEGS